ncbi:MAG: hypothetical protein DDT32_01225 [Syntrophomonadaceae bacterium]|nr:hypothetical protein [Bacillota bacterium]MBT9147468.1 hypothetical protein [Bacillota bacterium]
MFAVQMANKLTRREEDMEDLLTSNVFGIWRYLPPHFGLLQFLRTAQRLDGTRLANLGEVDTAGLEFWPWMHEPGAKSAEPDVLIEMVLTDQRSFLVLVEAKYRSGKSSFRSDSLQPNDQLARQMDNLRRTARRKGIDDYALVYVTADTLMPKSDIQEAISELADKTREDAASQFYWTSWRRLPSLLAEVYTSCEDSMATMLTDLHTIICRLGLIFFEGVTSRGWTLARTPWMFEHPRVHIAFEWEPITPIHYIFAEAPVRFSWELASQPNRISWRWQS